MESFGILHKYFSGNCDLVIIIWVNRWRLWIMLKLWINVHVVHYKSTKRSTALCVFWSSVRQCVCVYVYVWFSSRNRRGGCWGISCRSVAHSATGPEDKRRRRRSKEAHNEVPEALCVGNTAGVQPGSLSYGDVLIMLCFPWVWSKSLNMQYLLIGHPIQYFIDVRVYFDVNNKVQNTHIYKCTWRYGK